MREDGRDDAHKAVPSGLSALERFLTAVAEKTNDPVHLRLLAACRTQSRRSALEAELRAVVAEILHDTPTT